MAGIDIGTLGYPDDLKDAVWQKKKGILGKAKKTGIGDLLDKAETAFKKIDLVKLDPRANNPKNKEALEKAVKEAKAYYKSNIPPLQEMMTKIIAQCEKVEKENSALLKGAKSGIADVKKAAETYRVRLKSLDLDAAVKEVEARIAKRQDLAKKLLSGSLAKFAAGAKAFLADPTPESWEKNIKQQGRSVSNSVAELEAYNKAFWKEFEKFKGFDLPTLKVDPKDPEFSKVATAYVKAAISQVKNIAAFKPS